MFFPCQNVGPGTPAGRPKLAYDRFVRAPFCSSTSPCSAQALGRAFRLGARAPHSSSPIAAALGFFAPQRGSQQSASARETSEVRPKQQLLLCPDPPHPLPIPRRGEDDEERAGRGVCVCICVCVCVCARGGGGKVRKGSKRARAPTTDSRRTSPRTEGYR